MFKKAKKAISELVSIYNLRIDKHYDLKFTQAYELAHSGDINYIVSQSFQIWILTRDKSSSKKDWKGGLN